MVLLRTSISKKKTVIRHASIVLDLVADHKAKTEHAFRICIDAEDLATSFGSATRSRV